jgi:hypothetical protein
MTTEAFPPSAALKRISPVVWVPLVPCAAIAAATSATPSGFLVRFFGLALLVGFGVWCFAVWGAAFDVVLDDDTAD